MDGADLDLLDPDLLATGVLPFVVIVAALLTAPVAWGLLWLYRRAVLRAMRASGGDAPLASAGAERFTEVGAFGAIAPPAAALRVVHVAPSDRGDVSRRAEAASRALSRGLVVSAAIYTLGGLAFASVIAGAWMIQAGGGFVLTRLLAFGVIALWPLVLTLYLAIASTRGERLLIGSAYAAAVMVVGAYALARNPELTAGQIAVAWLIVNLAPTVVLVAFLTRPMRAVGPLVLAFMLLAAGGATLLPMLITASDRAFEVLIEVAVNAGLGAVELLVLMPLAGFVLCGLLGWWLLGRLGSSYQLREFSDQSLTLDAIWLTFGMVEATVLAVEGWPWVVTGLVAFLAWMVVTRVGFRLTTRHLPRRGDELSLLLLRVFALGGRSQGALDALAKRWRRVGTIEMIAGPDLVTAVVEPHEFLDFIAGRLSRRFVRGERDLDERVRSRDLGPDPDGRYRVNEFFCHADTWQPTMNRLARDADVVLMDLRSFSPANQGCIVELEYLLEAVPLDRVLLLEDESTDAPFLHETLEELWARLPAASPNRALDAPRLRVVRVGDDPDRAMASLVRLLLDVSLAPREESPPVASAVVT